MHIPRHWAEHRRSVAVPGGRKVNLHRIGWSDASPAAAQAHAEARTAEAERELQSGRKPTRRELKDSYGGDGLPIREEIVAEHPEVGAVITRNGYGARCLNVADWLFADVDLDDPAKRFREFLASLPTSLFALAIGWWWIAAQTSAARIVITVIVLGLLFGLVVQTWRRWRWARTAGSPEGAMGMVESWCAAHPTWLIHAYRTPAGLRLLATHAPLDPLAAETHDFFNAVRADPVYRRMCRLQACFRARLTAKPWRIGFRPRFTRCVWPLVRDDARQRREAWVADYETAAAGFAACEWLAKIGSGTEDPRGAALRQLHDRLSRTGQGLPLA